MGNVNRFIKDQKNELDAIKIIIKEKQEI